MSVRGLRFPRTPFLASGWHLSGIRLIRTWELLRFHSKLEKSSDEVEDVKDDRPIGRAYERSTFWPRV
jgi:hypothetical protein